MITLHLYIVKKLPNLSTITNVDAIKSAGKKSKEVAVKNEVYMFPNQSEFTCPKLAEKRWKNEVDS